MTFLLAIAPWHERPQGAWFEPRSVAFAHAPSMHLESVSVVGGFNDWDRARNPLELSADGKTWRGTFDIQPGVYPYLFVEDGSRWVPDPKAPPFPDANGNVNSKLVVLPLDYDKQPGRVGDGKVTASAALHWPNPENTVRLDENRAYVKLLTRARDVAKVWVVLEGGERFPMQRVAGDELFDTWRGEFQIPRGPVTRYSFLLEDGGKGYWLGESGLSSELSGVSDRSAKSANSDLNKPQTPNPTPRTPFAQALRSYPLPREPDWVQDAVFYQIFPERFDNGDPTNDGPGVEPWGSKPTGRNRMGGDLAGIRKRLDYLSELGVNALYLNPVFQANSNHAYDTVDYKTVDARFGTNQELGSLVKALKGKGIRTLLDGVFNHSSPDFFAFKDVIENGWWSAYRRWYFLIQPQVEVREGQKTYRTFAGVPSMPKLNQDDRECAEYFLGIGERWIRDMGIAGWRLDVADQVSQEFWRAFRKRVKQADPESYIVGEVWGDAHEYLQGDQHDAVMNYRWREAVLNFLKAKDPKPSVLDRDLARIRQDYPRATLNAMYNLLGSHDTERLRTVLKGDRAKERLAVALQFCYPGVPSIYYGDEIGMEGGKDPDERRCMIWDRSKWDGKLREVYRRLIRIRKERPSLRRGDFRVIAADDARGLFRFERRLGKERTQLVANISGGCRDVKVEKGFEMIYASPGLELRKDRMCAVGPMSFAIVGNVVKPLRGQK
ncbi:MAG: alpha amylase N-terminal ig-like domain-containing protein [Armatimonadetes bacterium]|nr:alpha amylase N-terminal ig-like domain-containing protein [Armatimonadota bacterium]